MVPSVVLVVGTLVVVAVTVVVGPTVVVVVGTLVVVSCARTRKTNRTMTDTVIAMPTNSTRAMTPTRTAKTQKSIFLMKNAVLSS